MNESAQIYALGKAVKIIQWAHELQFHIDLYIVSFLCVIERMNKLIAILGVFHFYLIFNFFLRMSNIYYREDLTNINNSSSSSRVYRVYRYLFIYSQRLQHICFLINTPYIIHSLLYQYECTGLFIQFHIYSSFLNFLDTEHPSFVRKVFGKILQLNLLYI